MLLLRTFLMSTRAVLRASEEERRVEHRTSLRRAAGRGSGAIVLRGYFAAVSSRLSFAASRLADVAARLPS
jgi:hypothetical protein